MTSEGINDVTKDLAFYKIRHLTSAIQEILDKWHYTNIDDFVNDTKAGKNGEDAIDDAIELQNLQDTLNELEKLLEMTD